MSKKSSKVFTAHVPGCPDDTSPPSKPQHSTSRLEKAVDISDLVLTTLENASRWAPSPYLQEVAGLALAIFSTVQGAKENRDSYERLATDVCNLAYSVLCISREREKRGKALPSGLVINIREFLDTLTMVNDFARKQTNRTYLRRLVSQKSDLTKIQETREKLRQALDVFGLQTNVTIRETVARLAERQEELCRGLQESEGSINVDPSPGRDQAQATPLPALSSAIPGFSGIRSSHGTFITIAGNQTTSTITNNNNSTNSGNITTITTTNSNNDSSVRTYADNPAVERWKKQPYGRPDGLRTYIAAQSAY